MELGAEHSAVEMFRMVVPIPHQDELPVGGLEQGQDAGQDLGVGGALGFPAESLVAAPGYVKGLERWVSPWAVSWMMRMPPWAPSLVVFA